MQFVHKLKKAEADFRKHHLQKIQDAASKSTIETRKTVRTSGEDQKVTFQEVVEITRPPTWTASAWLGDDLKTLWSRLQAHQDR